MGDVIQFPDKTLKSKLEDSMEEIRDSLTGMYEALDKVRKGMENIQGQTHEMEDNYQKLMIMYIEEVGEDNVPLELFHVRQLIKDARHYYNFFFSLQHWMPDE